MNQIRRLNRQTTLVSKWLSAACLLVLVVLVIVDVLTRALSIPFVAGISEIANYLQISLVYIGLAFAYYDGSFIRMDLLLGRFSGRVETLRSVIVQVISIATVIVIFWYALKTMLNSYAFGILSIGVLRVELYIPQAILCFGLALFIVQMILGLILELLEPKPLAGSEPTHALN